MSDPFSNEPSRDRNRRDDSVFHPPSYSISHGPDKALQWDPPADSDELAIALSYHFPIQKTLKKKMQAAVEKFLQQAKPRRPDLVEFNQDLSPSRSGAVRRISEAIPGLLSLDATTLEEVKVKRKRRAYETAERAKVGSNRGNACEVHRRQKLKVRWHRPTFKAITATDCQSVTPKNAEAMGSSSRVIAGSWIFSWTILPPNPEARLFLGREA